MSDERVWREIKKSSWWIKYGAILIMTGGAAWQAGKFAYSRASKEDVEKLSLKVDLINQNVIRLMDRVQLQPLTKELSYVDQNSSETR